MLLEDDWVLCPQGLAAAQYAIRKAHRYDPRWLALRVSYGFNGVVVPQADLNALSSHLGNPENVARRPPDHLLYEWFSGENLIRDAKKIDGRVGANGTDEQQSQAQPARSFRVFRYNLFHHIGAASTLAQPAGRHNPACLSQLFDWMLPGETFKEKECPRDDIWPCREAEATALDAQPLFFSSLAPVKKIKVDEPTQATAE